ncbi:GAF domain-containing protein [Thermodesulfobacteriota bacterium]
MTLSDTGKSSIEEKGLRYRLLIVEILIVILPSLILSYIFYKNNIFLDFSQMFIFALILLIILAGLMTLHQIFDRFFTMTTLMKKAVNNNEYLVDIQEDTAELHEITVSFNNLMKKYEDTTSELGRRVFELFAIKELTEVAGKSLVIDDLLNLLLEKVMAVTKAQMGSVFMVESENGRFRIVASKGLESGTAKGSYIKIDESLVRYVVSEKRPFLVKDIETDLRTRKQNDPKYGPPSFLSMPIYVREDLIAVLNLSHKETEQVFDSYDQEILDIIIGEIGFALENAQLHLRVEKHLINLQERTAELIKANDELQQEITKRNQTEEKLQTAHEQLKEANKKLGFAYSQMRDSKDLLSMQLQEEEVGFLIDENGQILGITERAIESTGRSRMELIRSNIVALVDVDSREELKNDIRNSWRGLFSKTSVRMIRNQVEGNGFDLKLMHITMEKGRMLLVLMRGSN